MRTSPLSTIAVVALLVFAGCTGLPSTGGNEPPPDASPADFPNASAIDQSVFDTHATALDDTSFTLTVEKIQKDRDPFDEGNFTYKNTTSRYLVEPDASQYRMEANGYFIGGNITYHSNGNTTYSMWRDDDELTVQKGPRSPVFNESSDRYLWGGWLGNHSGDQLDHATIDATFQREGVETFQGVPVMRYEATGVDALSDSWAGGENASSWYEEFSATLLLDQDGVIRHYEYEIVWADYHTRSVEESYTLSDVGSTDVEKPDWATNATAGS